MQRTQTASTSTHGADTRFDLDAYSDDELDTLLFTDKPQQKAPSAVGFPAIMGFVTLLVGLLYVIGEVGGGLLGLVGLGGLAPDLSGFVLPTLFAAVVTILATGTGIFQRKKRVKKVKTKAKRGGVQVKVTGDGRKLTKSRDRKIAGVAGGIAEYFNLDPKVVRIAFAIGAFASQGAGVLLYLILAAAMPKPETMTLEERIRIIRDS